MNISNGPHDYEVPHPVIVAKTNHEYYFQYGEWVKAMEHVY